MTAIAALYSDEVGLCVEGGEGGREEGGKGGGGEGEGWRGGVEGRGDVSAYWSMACTGRLCVTSSHLIGYFSPGSLPRWKSSGCEEWFIWV